MPGEELGVAPRLVFADSSGDEPLKPAGDLVGKGYEVCQTGSFSFSD
jgi:hypothetical protein